MSFAEWLLQLARSAGPVGLLLLAILDSAGIPTGGGPDLLLLLLASQESHPPAVAVLALLATIGSTLGCLVLYGIGRRSGRMALRRFPQHRVEAVRRRLQKHGRWVIFLAVLAPPPYPTKLFIICAGVFGMPALGMGLSVLVGRALRYGLGGYVGMHFGVEGLLLIQQNAWWFGVALLAMIIALVIITVRRRRGT